MCWKWHIDNIHSFWDSIFHRGINTGNWAITIFVQSFNGNNPDIRVHFFHGIQHCCSMTIIIQCGVTNHWNGIHNRIIRWNTSVNKSNRIGCFVFKHFLITFIIGKIAFFLFYIIKRFDWIRIELDSFRVFTNTIDASCIVPFICRYNSIKLRIICIRFIVFESLICEFCIFKWQNVQTAVLRNDFIAFSDNTRLIRNNK